MYKKKYSEDNRVNLRKNMSSTKYYQMLLYIKEFHKGLSISPYVV